MQMTYSGKDYRTSYEKERESVAGIEWRSEGRVWQSERDKERRRNGYLVGSRRKEEMGQK